MTATDLGSIDAIAESLMEVETPEEEERDDEFEADADEAEVDEAEAEEAEAETDDDDHDGEEVQEEPSQQLYTVKVDGKPKEVTLDELTRGYSGQQYIQQNLEQMAAAKKEMQAQYQH